MNRFIKCNILKAIFTLIAILFSNLGFTQSIALDKKTFCDAFIQTIKNELVVKQSKTNLFKKPTQTSFVDGEFTQSQAHLRNWFDKQPREAVDYDALTEDILRQEYGISKDGTAWNRWGYNLPNEAYLVQTAKNIIANENKHKDCYVFYHGHAYALTPIYDLYQELQKIFHVNPQVNIVVRFLNGEYSKFNNINDYVDYWQPHFGIGWSHPPAVTFRKHVICANMALFGNTSDITSKECSFDYFANSFNAHFTDPTPFLNDFFDDMNFDATFVNGVVAAFNKYMHDDSGRLLQIFIHKSIVDDVAMLFHPRLQPYSYPITHTFDSRKNRHTDVSSILELYTNDYMQVQTWYQTSKYCMDTMQVRIFADPKIFNNPELVKVYRYSAQPVDTKQEQKYREKLTDIAFEIVQTWLEDEFYNMVVKNAAKTINLFKSNLISQKIFAEETEFEKRIKQEYQRGIPSLCSKLLGGLSLRSSTPIAA